MQPSEPQAGIPAPAGQVWSPRRLNAIAATIGAQTYLEIGVARGATFVQVSVPYRTGVDPNFQFDVASVANPTTNLAAMTSDAFFCQLPAATRFDLVFIDGLHSFEQTYRDLCSVLAHTHDRSVILIDDTLPSDVYSTLPSAERAFSHRKRTGDESMSWHGDVFKVVYAIHDFHFMLDYRTIVGSGNPQTLVWRSTDCRAPRTSSMEALSRLSYFDLMESLDALRPVTESDALDACLRALNSA